MSSNKELAQKAPALSARQRIQATAADLFYRNGYQATGVSEIVAEADVAKATFYAHFESKEELCVDYLKEYHRKDLQAFRDNIEAETTPMSRYLSPARTCETVSAESSQRGCRFLNISAEMPNTAALRQESADHYRHLRSMIRPLVVDLKESDPQAYRSLHVDGITDTYLLLIGGGLIVAELLSDLWPAQHISYAVQQMVTPANAPEVSYVRAVSSV